MNLDEAIAIANASQSTTIHHGDCLNVMRTFASDTFDSVVTDPPAGISFMGKAFDHDRGGRTQWITWLSERLAEAYRITKPGGRLLCWSIPRTMHWTGMAVEDAGWKIENVIAHLQGQGFPKSKTTLKPAREDWWLARKPGKGKVPPLNIDECRVGLSGGTKKVSFTKQAPAVNAYDTGLNGPRGIAILGKGRWPANVVLSHSPGCVRLGEKRVAATSIHGVAVRRSGVHAEAWPQAIGREQPVRGYADADGKEPVAHYACTDDCAVAGLDRKSGLGASRFFNTFDADQEDQDEDDAQNEVVYEPKAGPTDRGGGNNHPTVKSTALMTHLCKLITPPGGLILDPFCGSGSTGKAALLEGFRFVGIEQDLNYVEIARVRLVR